MLACSPALGQSDAGLRREEADGSRAIAVLLDVAAVVLGAGRRVHGGPTALAVVAQAVDVAAEVGGVASGTVHPVALVAELVVQHVGLDLHLCAWRDGEQRSFFAVTETE